MIDTKKTYESGQDIIQLTKELNEQFDSLFSRISNISTKTGEWFGPSAEEFIRRTNLEKKQYAKIINSLNKYGKELIDASTAYESCVNKLR